MLIGFVSFIVDYSLYIFFLTHNISVNIAKASASFIAILCNLFLNSRFNFGTANTISFSFAAAFILLYSILTVVHVALNALFLKLLGTVHVAVLSALVLSTLFNYFWVTLLFSRSKKN